MRPSTDTAVVLDAARTAWRADRAGTLVAAVMQLVGAASALGVVLASKLALDALLADSTDISTSLVGALVLLSVTTAVSSSVAVLQREQQRLLGEKVSQYVWSSLLRSCVSVDLITWESPDFIDRLDRVRSNALQRPTAVVTSLMGLAGSAIGVLGMAAALVTIHPLLLPVLLAAGLPSILFSRRASRAEFAFVRSTTAILRRRLYLKQIITNRANAAEVRAFDSGPHLLARHAGEDAAYLARLRPHARRRQVWGLLSTAASAIALALTLLVIVLFVDQGRISLAEAGAAAIAARLLGSQLSTALSTVGTLIESGPFLADMKAFLDAAPPPTTMPRPRDLTDALVLDRVSFSYGGQREQALTEVSIRVPRGGVVAVVGENGSGKTTMAKVLSGLYSPSSGARCWDGDQDIEPQDLRASVTVLFQDFVRYQMSGADNIAIAQTAVPVDLDRVRAAAERVGIGTVLDGLEQGYRTPLGMELGEGSDLSGGQWQRLALARALYRDAPVVVLDEPTAAMDPRAEHELFADVRRVLDGRAALLISHRYSSVRLADFIYVMSDGRVIEEGTHEDLMALRGHYADLYSLQAAAYLR